jgi:RNA polymerase primary sigma factor
MTKKQIEIKAEIVRAAYEQNKSLLNIREKDIITKYYGISPNVRHSLAELGEIYGVTRERIRQIKVLSLEKLGVESSVDLK